MDWYVSERTVEVPFILKYARGPDLLDVGKDSTGYTRELENRGFTVESVDPSSNRKATYRVQFEHLDIGDRVYDTILFLSSLEHFDLGKQNLALAINDIYCICKARAMLVQGGRVIVTVPFGRMSVPGDFIQWNADRVNQVRQYSGMSALMQKVMLRNPDDTWSEVSMHDCGNVLYRNDGRGANAVYMGVWQ